MLQIVPPAELSSNKGTPRPLGRIQSSRRLLESVGWRVIIVPASSFPRISSDRAVFKAVGQILEKHGIPTDWLTAVKSAPR